MSVVNSDSLSDPLANIRRLASETLSVSSLAKCRGLAEVVYTELDIETPRAVSDLLSGRMIAFLKETITTLATEQRAIAIEAIAKQFDLKNQLCQKVAAIGELFGLFDGENDPVFLKLLQLRNISVTSWRSWADAKDNLGPKKQRQLCAGPWLRPLSVHSYKAVQGRELELLKAFLATYQVYLHENIDDLRLKLASREILQLDLTLVEASSEPTSESDLWPIDSKLNAATTNTLEPHRERGCWQAGATASGNLTTQPTTQLKPIVQLTVGRKVVGCHDTVLPLAFFMSAALSLLSVAARQPL